MPTSPLIKKQRINRFDLSKPIRQKQPQWLKLTLTTLLAGSYTLVLVTPRSMQMMMDEVNRQGAFVQPATGTLQSLELSPLSMLSLNTGQIPPNQEWFLDNTLAPLAPTNTSVYTYTADIGLLEINILAWGDPPSFELFCETSEVQIDGVSSSIPCLGVNDLLITDTSGESGSINLKAVTFNPPHFQNLLVTVIGGQGPDTIYGSQFSDTLYGDMQDPLIECEYLDNNCNDLIYPGEGDDLIYPGQGNDVVDNGPDDYRNYGNDTVVAGNGADSIEGSDGYDWLVLQSDQNLRVVQNDVFVGAVDTGSDIDDIYHNSVEYMALTGSDQPNRIDASQFSGSVILAGLVGDDTLIGSAGFDTLFGGSDEDSLVGGAGADWIQGDDGYDTLLGGTGADTLVGGAEDDIFVLDLDFDQDSLIGGEGNDNLYVNNPQQSLHLVLMDDNLVEYGVYNPLAGDIETALWIGSQSADLLDASGFSGQVSLEGGAGDDTLRGGAGADYLHVTDGANLLVGNGNNDSLFGGSGKDTLYGGPGADILEDLSGDNHMDGGNGNDTLLGGSGNDYLRGGAQNDHLFGGSGNDTLNGDLGSDGYEIPTGSGRTIIILEPVEPGSEDIIYYYASGGDETIRLRDNVLNCKTDRVVLHPEIEQVEIWGLGGDDFYDVYPSKTIRYFLDGGDQTIEDTLNFHIPPGSAVDYPENNPIVANGYASVELINFEKPAHFIQELWRILLAFIRRTP
jgi:Ca2+-binding RTX toxin-like protein